MRTRAIPAGAATGDSKTQNDRFKESFESWLWGSIIAATVIHFMAFQFWPTRTVGDVSYTAEELLMIELPPEIEIPPPPEAITRPATPVIATAQIDDDVTIALTTFADNPVSELPPPPVSEGGPDLSAAPAFTPMTVKPEIINLAEIQRALMILYPPNLRATGVGGKVVVWFFISTDGRVLDRRIFASSGYRGLDDAALEVADVFRFSPALNRDKRIQVWIQFPIVFEVQ